MEVSKEDEMKNRKYIRLLAWISSVLMLFGMVYNVFVPMLYKIIMFLLLIIFALLSYKRLNKVITVILSVILIFMSTFLIYTQMSADSVLKYYDHETNEISLVVLKDGNISNISDITDNDFGYLKAMSSEWLTIVKDELADSFDLKPKFNVYATVSDAIEALREKKIDVLVIDNAFFDVYQEEDPTFESDTKIIHTISKIVSKDDITKDIDVDKDTFTILVSGIDIFGSITKRSRSDVNMLLVVNPKRGTVLMVSIPRDTYVPLSCKDDEMDKLTHSGLYGINCTSETIEQFLDIEINYYIRLNFTSFINIVDALDGIKVYNDMSFTSHDGMYFPKGNLTLNGFEAFHFARERKAFEGGDSDRVKNQQKVLEAMVKKLLTPAMFIKVDQLIRIVSKNIDTNITSSDIAKLIRLQLDKNPKWQFASTLVLGEEAYRETFSMPGRDLFVVLPDPSSVATIHAQINDMYDDTE
jgi:polyisoprenyl-teichoic acid--peptidoglycan teichoic acid transferase